MNNEQTDSMIVRERTPRTILFFILPVVVFIATIALSTFILSSIGIWWQAGAILGTGAGIYLGGIIVKLSLIQNEAVNAFVTINPLHSLFNEGSALVSYGPGTHFCFPWETRISGNNVFLGSVAETIKGTVQCIDGTLTKEASFRFRANITGLPTFIAGVGSVASDFSSLIEAEIVEDLSRKTVREALNSIEALNRRLKEKFVEKDGVKIVTTLEKQYEMTVEDVTVNQLLPSSDIAKTMGATTEADLIANATVALLCTTRGLTLKQYQSQVRRGKIKPEEITEARDRIMAMSGNLEGMKIQRNEIKINGLDIPPEAYALTIAAIAAMKGDKK